MDAGRDAAEKGDGSLIGAEGKPLNAYPEWDAKCGAFITHDPRNSPSALIARMRGVPPPQLAEEHVVQEWDEHAAIEVAVRSFLTASVAAGLDGERGGDGRGA